MKKPLAIMLALMMALCVAPATAFAEAEPTTSQASKTTPEQPKLDEFVSKSKTATNLDANYVSEVTLSLPSAEEKLASDVVFVLDKSTSAALEDAALKMLKDLKAHVKNTGAAVKVGVVIFNKTANVVAGLTNLDDAGYTEIEKAIKTEVKSGTNTHAGLLAGKKMLDDDQYVDADRKYLIFFSDGITYIFNENPTAVAWLFGKKDKDNWASPDNWELKYGNNNPPDDWDTRLNEVGTQINTQGVEYEYAYKGTPTKETPLDKKTVYANSVDKALYLTKQVYEEAKKAGYNCYAMAAEGDGGKSYLWGPSFMSYLAGDKKVTFEQIENDILYLVDAGSTVIDTMGKTADYDFDFISSAADISLNVGEKAYTASAKTEGLNANETARYLFTSDGVTAANGSEAPFVLHYYAKGADGAGGECFVWDINVPVTNFARVKLTYKVKLTNPKTAPGTYGAYDWDGSRHYNELYTNNSAILKPVSNNVAGKEQEFNKPTVSYTVSGGHYHPDPTPVPPIIVNPPKTGDMTIWRSILNFLGIR